MNRREDDKGILMFMKIAKILAPIILGLVSIVSAFAVIQSKVVEHSEELKRNSSEHQAIMQRISRLESIIDVLPEMRADIKSLLREQRRNR